MGQEDFMASPQTQATKAPADPSDKMAGEALAQAIKYLQAQWRWSGKDLSNILHIPASTINTWLGKENIPVSKPFSPEVQAILALVAIHKNLEAIFEEKEHQLKWLNTEHPDMFKAPVKKMEESIEGLIGVRQYLDYVRGRGA